MRRLLRRALLGAVVAGLVTVLGATPVPAGVGTRLANGDSDTSGKCLSIEDTGRGHWVEMATCTTNAHQGWVFQVVVNTPSPIVWVKSQDADARNRCLTGYGEGRQVRMDPCSNLRADQEWIVRSAGGAWRQLENVQYGFQCLDVRDNGEDDVVQTWQCGPTDKGNQKWKFF